MPVTTLLRMAGHNATEAALDPRQQLWHEMQRSYELLPPTDQTEINIMLDVLAREIQRRQSLNKNNPLPEQTSPRPAEFLTVKADLSPK